MAFSKKLLSSVAVLCAATSVASAVPEPNAQQMLDVATRTAQRLTSCPSTADDLVGQAALKLMRLHRDVLTDDTRSRDGYVRTAVTNLHRDDLRRKRRMKPESEFQDGEVPAPELTVDPASHFGFEELAVEEFRSSLEPHDREVLDLLELGYKDRAIAAELGRTRHDVRKSIAMLRSKASVEFEESAVA